jgi:hypothetical protein
VISENWNRRLHLFSQGYVDLVALYKIEHSLEIPNYEGSQRMAHTLGFGRYRSKTLEWLFFNDPGYVWWMIDDGAEKNLKEAARTRFDQLVRRAKQLAVPGKCRHCDKPISRMSVIEHPSGGLARVDFFCEKCHHGDGSHSLLTTPAFYTPDFFKSYDKLGGKILVDAIKYAYYGKKVQMTQTKMEEFFDKPSNFVNP